MKSFTITGKKGQTIGQVFIYIMAAVVIGVIALVGYSAIKNVITKSCDAEKITFKSDMESMIEKYTSYGSLNKRVFPAPCDYDEICFVDSSAIIGSTNPEVLTKCTNNIIRNSAAEGIEQNVFVISSDRTLGLAYSELVELDDPSDCLCIKRKNNNFYLTFEGEGSRVKISETG